MIKGVVGIGYRRGCKGMIYIVIRCNDTDDIRGIFSDYDEAWDVCDDLNDTLTYGFKVVSVDANKVHIK